MCYFAQISRKNEAMNLSLMIARRMAQRTPGHKPGVMERIAVWAAALGMVAMILSLAVVTGFKREIAARMTGFAAHVSLCDRRSLSTPDASPVRRTARLEELVRSVGGVRSMTPVALKGGVVRSDETVEGVMLKGVGPDYDRAAFAAWLRAGALPRIGDSVRAKEVLLSESLAARLRLAPGDKLELLFIDGERPRRDRFRVAGIYASGMEELDAAVMLTDLRNVQRLSGWHDDEISGYEIRLADLAEAETFADRLNRLLLYDEGDETLNLVAESVTERYASLFDWLRTHDVNAAVVIGIMLLVAFFNLSSAMLVLVLERTRMIGLMKALGMGNGALRRIFLYRAGFIALRGLLWGNAVGLGLCLLQSRLHLLRLDAEGYLLDEVPVAVEWSWWLPLNAGFVAAILLLLLLPTRIITSVKPAETIRYE